MVLGSETLADEYLPKPLVLKTFGGGQVTTEGRAASHNGCKIVARRSAYGVSRSARMAFGS